MFTSNCIPCSIWSSRYRVQFLFGVMCVFCCAHSFSPSEAAERNSPLVQAALQSEIDLDRGERTRLLDAALERDPKSPEVHWARGEVNVQGNWLSLESAAFDSKDREDLKQYRQWRDEAGNTIEAQMRLARFCRSHHLPAQERTHLTAVLALAPNHIEARQRLGQINVQGMWIDERQLEQQRKTERATTEYLQRYGKELVKLSNALYDKSWPRHQIVRNLNEFRNPSVIPGLESVLSIRGEDGALCVVESLASLPAPEASLSLVRHAMDYPVESVRSAATKSLKRRDEHSFIPVLLAALKKPVQKRDDFAMTSDNLLIWRQSISVESQDTKKIATLDRVIPLQGPFATSMLATATWTRQALLTADFQLDRLNREIELNNDRVMELLANTTKQTSTMQTSMSKPLASKTTPEDWWNWWNDRIESYPTDTKEVQVRYEVALVQLSVPEFPSGARRECLAAGTPIWTETGPVAVDLVKPGDLVLTQNPRSGELKFAPVLATTVRPPELLLRLSFGGETVRATGGHPFWVSGKGWVKARSLEPGMGLHTARGVVVLDSIEEERTPAEAYNLIVDEWHSYFVGRNLILSHDNTVRQPVATRVPGLRNDITSTRIE